MPGTYILEIYAHWIKKNSTSVFNDVKVYSVCIHYTFEFRIDTLKNRGHSLDIFRCF